MLDADTFPQRTTEWRTCQVLVARNPALIVGIIATMNTGKGLEGVVRTAVEELVRSGALGLTAECCRVFLNKGYFSRDRDSDILVDVSIELVPRGMTKPSLIWIWECKDYAGAVSVAEIEEFHAKLEQIGADLTKGTFVTTGYYQKGAVEYAGSKGIGLTRLVDGGQIKVERIPGLYMRLPDYAACEDALTQQRIGAWERLCAATARASHSICLCASRHTKSKGTVVLRRKAVERYGTAALIDEGPA